MKEYLYLWIEKYRELNDFGSEKYQFEDFGMPLSSKYIIDHVFTKSTKNNERTSLRITVVENDDIPPNFFSDDIIDVKAFVGKNGTGKTTLLEELFYQIIDDSFGDVINGHASFALVFKENDEIKCYKSPKLDECTICFTKKGQFETDVENIHLQVVSDINLVKSKGAIFYTAAFNTKKPLEKNQVVGMNNLSTNALLGTDDETLKNLSSKYRLNKENGTDFFNSHYKMELMRKVIFATHFYDYFANNDVLKFRMPNCFIIAPNMDDIKNAITEIGGGDGTKRWNSLYNSITDFSTRFRFAALLNHVRADLSNSDMQAITRKNIEGYINPEMIKSIGLEQVIKEYSLNHFITEEHKFCVEIEKALDLLKPLQSFQENFFKIYPWANKDSYYFDLADETHKHVLENFIESYLKIMKLTPFLFMNWRPQSSGEEKFIEFFSRLYYKLKIQKVRGNECEKIIHLIIDEADLYLHPEWQRHWLFEFKEIMRIVLENLYPNKNDRPKIQIFFSTHSPFIITDLPRDNIVFLNTDSEGRTFVDTTYNISPFGANLYDLLSNGFFVGNSVGVFSEKMIEDLVRYRRGKYEFEPDEKDVVKKRMNYVFKSIGDPIVGSLINEMKDESGSARTE